MRYEIEAIISRHRQRKSHDRQYLHGIVADAEKIFEAHLPTPGVGSPCAACARPWPCGAVQMLRSEQFWVD